MTKEEIISKTNSALIAKFNLSHELMKPESSFVQDLKLDSLDIVNVIICLEEAFDVKLRSNYDVDKIKNLGSLYDFIKEQLN
ncbi:MAG: phosphopantetheine-binding protein [Elusimicrobiota bacterium]|jgi:acyl carrier protein|nr:phosphopantetheine-binding protein [Elusimicrobiota bacterium]